MNAYELASKKSFTLTKPIIKEAEKNDVSVSVVSEKNSIFKFTYNDKFFYVVGDTMPFCRKYKPTLVKNKDATKKLLEEYDIAVPKGIRARSLEKAVIRIKEQEMEFPLILKPLDGLRAYGVTWDINSLEKLERAIHNFEEIRKEKISIKSKYFIVEEQFEGDEFRVLVLGDKIIACAKKLPATVIGDGASTIAQLIDSFNKNREDNFHIVIDNVVKKSLKKRNDSLESVPEKDEKVKLRSDMMLANGGRAINYSQKISPELEELCVKAARAVGLEYAGIDILIKKNDEDLLTPKEYKIIEVNTMPGHILNEAPLVENPSVNVSKMLLEYFLGEIKK